ncbi:MAG TPA: DUF58 domain-containing protein [Acidobacteriota bacterium]|nr:DUF58 domain-containing protein [Acidobacteriota bacterium]
MRKLYGILKFPYRKEKPSREKDAGSGLFPFSFTITGSGALFLVITFSLSLAALATGNNLLYLLLSAFLSMIVTAGALSRISLNQVSLVLQIPENVFVGETTSLKLSAQNNKRVFPSFSIMVENPDVRKGRSATARLKKVLFKSQNRRSGTEAGTLFSKAAYFPVLKAGETRSEIILQSFPRRGRYTLHGFWISTSFPFGFFRRGEPLQAEGELLVYPSIRDISTWFHLLPFIPGQQESRRIGPGENLFSIREYRDGETARIINWKATAKTGRLMAQENAREEETRLCLMLDTRMQADGSDHETVFERAVSLAAGIAAHFLDEGAGVAFITPHEYLAVGTGADHLYRILRILAAVSHEPFPTSGTAELWSRKCFPGIDSTPGPDQLFSEKTFKIILTSQPRGSFPSVIWRSSRVVFFDEL